MNSRSLPTLIVKWTMLALITVAMLFPLAWMAIAGFKSRTEVLATPFQFFPEVWHWENYLEIFQNLDFMRSMGVTFLGAMLFVIIGLAINSSAAYAFARLEFRGKKFFWVFCIAPMFIPAMAILITSFVVVTNLNMLNTIWVLVLPPAASAAQMFFLRQYYLSIPTAIEEAALIDGCSRFRVFTKIFVPQSFAVFTVVGMTMFLGFWNSFVWPILTITDPNMRMIMQYLNDFRGERGTDWGMLMAGSVVAAIPAILLLLIFQRYIVSGARLAGMK